MMTYRESIAYLESFINYEEISVWPYKQSLKLNRIKDFLKNIGNPQDSLKCIHIAGTKGKGSTCAFIAYILRQAGLKAGLYTSPHLSDFRERIRILDYRPSPLAPRPSQDFEGMISGRDLALLVERTKPVIEKYNRNSKYGPLSFFEVYTALAFVYFKEREVDCVVLETGLGGRLDATNVVDSLICVITPISYEHTQKLGKTLRAIAAEKAGIIKNQKIEARRQKIEKKNKKFPPVALLADSANGTEAGLPSTQFVISAPQEGEAMEVIRKRCEETGVKLYEAGRDVVYERDRRGFSVKGVFCRYTDLKVKLIGRHQMINAAVAVAAVDALRLYGINIDADSVRRGLYNTLWPGRCEVISRRPFIVLDGAQNVASAGVLKEAIKGEFKYKRLILILGISKDKDIPGICGQLCPLADEIILTRADNPRAASVDYIEGIIKAQSAKTGRAQIIKTENVREAEIKARAAARKEDLILVTGSLFVVGEIRSILSRVRYE